MLLRTALPARPVPTYLVEGDGVKRSKRALLSRVVTIQTGTYTVNPSQVGTADCYQSADSGGFRTPVPIESGHPFRGFRTP
jgi:hypothetical protein